MSNIGMVDSKNMSVPVRIWIVILSFIFGRQDHYISVTCNTGMHRVLFTPHVVRRVIDTKDFVLEDCIALNDDCTTIRWGKVQFIAIVFVAEELRQKVVFEAGKEILASMLR